MQRNVFVRRLVALLIDAAVLGLTAYLLAAALGPNPDARKITETDSFGLIYFFLNIVYFALTDGCIGMSIGKASVGLRTINAEGEPLGLLRGMWRSLLRIVSVSAIVPALIALFTNGNRGLHDYLAGSSVRHREDLGDDESDAQDCHDH